MTSRYRLGTGCLVAGVVALSPFAARAQQAPPAREVTFTKDIAPMLQRSCENCHRPTASRRCRSSTYEDVRPWARAIKQRTASGPRPA